MNRNIYSSLLTAIPGQNPIGTCLSDGDVFFQFADPRGASHEPMPTIGPLAPKMSHWLRLGCCMYKKNSEEMQYQRDDELGGGFKFCLFSPLFGEDSHFD